MNRRNLFVSSAKAALATAFGSSWFRNTAQAQTSQPASNTVSAATPLDRTVLPVPEPEYPPITELDARNAKAPPRFEVKAPNGAPNVVAILLDNFGFGDGSTFGGPWRLDAIMPQSGNEGHRIPMPIGHFAEQSRPQRSHPRNGAMLVLVHVSSMKTSRAGSISF